MAHNRVGAANVLRKKSRAITKNSTKRNHSRRNSKSLDPSFIPTFHVLIPSGGRKSLRYMIDSLKPQLMAGDAVTVVFDGQDAHRRSGFNPSWFHGFSATANVAVQEPRIGYWSHGLQNKYTPLLKPVTTFIMNADDDDTYLPGSFDKLRRKCLDPECLYITRMSHINNPFYVVPRDTGPLRSGNIGTPNGIVPFKDAAKVKWGLHYGGDFTYYNALKDHVKRIQHLPDVIYAIGQEQGDVRYS